MVSDRLSRGDAFADVAAELSDDLGSAGLGGELGFTDGTAFPEEMEAAIAMLALREKYLSPSRPMPEHILFVLRNESRAMRLIMRV